MNQKLGDVIYEILNIKWEISTIERVSKNNNDPFYAKAFAQAGLERIRPRLIKINDLVNSDRSLMQENVPGLGNGGDEPFWKWSMKMSQWMQEQEKKIGNNY